MVRVLPLVAGLAAAISTVQALPAQVMSEKRAEAAPNLNAQLQQISTALQQLADTPTSSSLNKNAGLAGAAFLGVVGALIGGAIGGFMPPNTTMTPQSIYDGLTTEVTQATDAVNALKQDGGLSLLTSLLPTLGALLASQPNLQRGEPNAPYVPPGPPPALEPKTPNAAQPKGPSTALPLPATPVPSKPTAAASSAAPAMSGMGGHGHGAGGHGSRRR